MFDESVKQLIKAGVSIEKIMRFGELLALLAAIEMRCPSSADNHVLLSIGRYHKQSPEVLMKKLGLKQGEASSLLYWRGRFFVMTELLLHPGGHKLAGAAIQQEMVQGGAMYRRQFH